MTAGSGAGELTAAVEAILARAEADLAELGSALRPGQPAVDATMRATQRCPACGGTSLLHAREVLDRGEAHGRLARSLQTPSWLRYEQAVGQLEAFVCTGCGLVEWRLADLAGLKVDGESARLVDGPRPEAPGARAAARLRTDADGPFAPLLARLASLEASLEALRASLPPGRWLADRSMKGALVCPACGASKLLHASRVLDRADGMVRAEMALAGFSWWRTKGKGRLEVWACTACLLVEWRVADPEAVPVDGVRVSLVEAPPPEPPGGWRDPLAPELRTALEGAEVEAGAVHAAAVSLAAAIARARDAAGDAATRAGSPMAEGGLCAACGGRRLLHATEVLDQAENGRAAMALAQPSWWRARGVGRFEAWVCAECGLVEWHVPDLSGVVADGEKIRLLDYARGDGEGPYR